MTRTQTLIATTLVAFAIPLGTAFAQMPGPSTAAPSKPAISQPISPGDIPSPMQEQAMAPNMAPISTVCGPNNSVTMKDEYGRKYNCRGDRVR
jgi:hypothetical protein